MRVSITLQMLCTTVHLRSDDRNVYAHRQNRGTRRLHRLLGKIAIAFINHRSVSVLSLSLRLVRPSPVLAASVPRALSPCMKKRCITAHAMSLRPYIPLSLATTRPLNSQPIPTSLRTMRRDPLGLKRSYNPVEAQLLLAMQMVSTFPAAFWRVAEPGV